MHLPRLAKYMPRVTNVSFFVHDTFGPPYETLKDNGMVTSCNTGGWIDTDVTIRKYTTV